MDAEIRQSLSRLLEVDAEIMGVALTEVQIDRLLSYLQLFNKWNKTFNLSAVRDLRAQLDRHLLDSLSVVPHIKADRLLDVGTGGGLPGIPLSIVYPQKQFTLLDSNGKKTRFLFQVKTELQLDNVTVENTRVEAYQPAQKFDGIISRAFASLEDMVSGCEHLLAEGGEYYAMKGLYPTDELSAVEKHYKVSDSYPLQVPREEGERHLLVLQPLSTRM